MTLGDTLTAGAPSPESIAADRELLQALYAELELLDLDGKRICQLIMAGMSEWEIAAAMGRRQPTVNYQKRKVLAALREALKDLYL